MAYLVQHFEMQGVYFTLINAIAICLVTVAIILINKTAYKKIDEIGEL